MYNFDEIINRKNTSCLKYDSMHEYFPGYSDLQPLWVADMDLRTPDFITDALKEKIDLGIFGYTRPTPTLIQAVISWMKDRHNYSIKEEYLTFVNGVVPAFSAAVEAFSNEGDEIIVQTPVYYPLFNHIKSNNRKTVLNPLKEENGYYTMDLIDLEKKISSKTKILVLCSPHNPVGRVWSKEELSDLSLICVKHGIKIIVDEIHADIVFKKFTSLASISEEIADITLTLNSAGKTFNIAGLNCGYAICHNKKMKNAFDTIVKKREVNAINLFGFVAHEAAYTKGHAWLEELKAYIMTNITFTHNYLSAHKSPISFIKPEATYLLWLSFKNINNSHKEVKKKLLNNAKVALNDGTLFGTEGNGYFRLNAALPKEQLEIALNKIVTNIH